MAIRAPVRSGFRCQQCGAGAPRWLGRCPGCQAWGSVAAAPPPPGPLARTAALGSGPARPLTEVSAGQAARGRTGLGELDRVLGGGLVAGSVVLLAGEPGVGKSTLLLDVARRTARAGAPALVISGEESLAQVRLRADRIGALSEHVYLAAETDLAAVLRHVADVSPALLVVDSVQTVVHPEVDGGPGSVSQVRECAAALARVAKERGLATVLVGHVTKDGSVAGPRVLEHLVDVVLAFEGDRRTPLRFARAVKNRFGTTDDLGCFELTPAGLLELPDPGALFLSRATAAEGVSGTCVTVALQGQRPLVAELQALVVPSGAPAPRRAISGLDAARITMLLAVVERRGGVALRGADAYLATVGGVRLTEPAADLAAALAVSSAAEDRVLPAGLVAIGEVGLAGEVRPVPGLARRLAQAARLGFHTAVVPGDGAGPHPGSVAGEVDGPGGATGGLEILPVPTLRRALRVMRELSPTAA